MDLANSSDLLLGMYEFIIFLLFEFLVLIITLLDLMVSIQVPRWLKWKIKLGQEPRTDSNATTF
jgi:hypothetical protein